LEPTFAEALAVWDLHLPLSEVVARGALAVAVGALLGLERRMHRKPAGVRTLALVSLGAAVFILSTLELIGAKTDGVQVDTVGRVMAAIIGGIGFLGAGTIIRTGEHVEGITTAAMIWVTAGIGVTCGLGQYGLAVVVASLALLAMGMFKVIERALAMPSESADKDQPPKSGLGAP